MSRKFLSLMLALALLLTAAASAETLTEKYAYEEGKHYEYDILSNQANPVENDAPLILYWNEMFDVTLNVVNAAGEALNVLIAAGDAPDTLVISGWATYAKLARDGVLLEMDEDVFKTYAPNFHQNITEYVSTYFDDVAVDGAIYGVDSINYWSAYHGPIVWNGEWLRAIGLDHAPATFDEMDMALRAFAHDDPDGDGQANTYGLSLDGMQLVYSAFGTIVPNANIFWQEMDGELYPSLITDEAKAALAYLAELYADGVVSPEFVTGENTGGYWALSHAFINGQIGMTGKGSHYHWAPGDPGRDYGGAGANWTAIYEINPEMALSVTYGQPIPTDKGWQYYQSEGTTYARAYRALNSDLEAEPDKVGKLLEIFDYIGNTDPEVLSTAIYGFKGEQWDYVTAFGRQVPARNADRTATDDILIGGNTMMFFLNCPQVYSAAYPENFIAAENMAVSDYVLQTAVATPLDAEAQFGDDCNTVKQEFYTAVIRGEKSIDEFDDFVKSWLEIGGQQIWDEAKAAWAK